MATEHVQMKIHGDSPAFRWALENARVKIVGKKKFNDSFSARRAATRAMRTYNVFIDKSMNDINFGISDGIID